MVCIWRHQNNDYTNYDQFVPNFVMAYETIQLVSVTDLKLFVPMKTELRPKKLENFLLFVWEKCVGRHCFAYQHGCRNINVWMEIF